MNSTQNSSFRALFPRSHFGHSFMFAVPWEDAAKFLHAQSETY